MAKEIKVIPLYNGTVYQLAFVIPRSKGYFAQHIKPATDIIKGLVPSLQRTYDPDTKCWEVADIYWPALRAALEALGFKMRIITSDGAPVDVPKQYADNFYHAPEPTAKVESKDTLLAQLEYILGPVGALSQEELRTRYRQAARRLHPDLGGDAAKMSELNRLWSLYNAS